MRRKAYPQIPADEVLSPKWRHGIQLVRRRFPFGEEISNWPVPGLDETRLRASLPLELHLDIPPEAPRHS